MADACGVSIRFDLPFEAVPACVGDVDRLSRAIIRIVTDAVKRTSRSLDLKESYLTQQQHHLPNASVTLFLEVVERSKDFNKVRFGVKYETFLPPVSASSTAPTSAAAPPVNSNTNLDMDLNLLIADRLLSLLGGGTLDFTVRPHPLSAPPARRCRS
ncbi:hypothetical protein BC829DRAFT_228975 [Chytridium lagenaria]|nr:hypothetical protein BC829DRAFT_228975 [Chytridium lagenaria]